jgi:hypothetical protein
MDAGQPSYVLSHWVRDEGLLDIGTAIRKISSEGAELFGIPGRGRLVPGAFGDVNVIDLAALRLLTPRMAADFPLGASRFVQQAEGYDYTPSPSAAPASSPSSWTTWSLVSRSTAAGHRPLRRDRGRPGERPRHRAQPALRFRPQRPAVKAGISREDMDAWACRSHMRAVAGIDNGSFTAEIVPVEVTRRDGTTVTFAVDEHPRRTSSLEKLASLKPLHPEIEGFSITAGNAAGVNDGAAAIVVTSGEFAARRGLEPLAVIRSWASAGVPPAWRRPWRYPRPWTGRACRSGTSTSGRSTRRSRPCPSR